VTVQGYSVDANTGGLTALPQGPVNIGQGFSQWVAADKAGRFLFVSSPSDNVHGFKIGQDNIAAFVIDKNTGNLTNAPGSPIVLAGSAGGIAVSPDGKFLYMSASSGVFAYSVNQTTAELTPLPGSPFATAGFLESEEIAVSPDGKFLYLDESDLGVFSLNASTGVPTEISGSPFQIGPSFFATPLFVDPLGRFLFAGGLLDSGPNVAVEQVAANGALTPAPGSPFHSGIQSTFVITDPRGKFLYVADNIADVIYAFTLDASTGSLTPVAGSPFSLGPNVSANIGGFATDAAGKFLFAGNGGTPMVFSIDPVTGALTPSASNAGGSPFENQLVTVAY
jgi:6-phosphogluconolactonase (cycloisomerase 2 family)